MLFAAGYVQAGIVEENEMAKIIEHVDNALSSKGLECYCVRYGAADKHVKVFDPKIAEIELEYMGKIIPDATAKAILKSKRK